MTVTPGKRISALIVATTVVLCQGNVASAGIYDGLDRSKAQYGSTVVIRPASSSVAKAERPTTPRKPIRIIGHASIAEFVTISLGFRPQLTSTDTR